MPVKGSDGARQLRQKTQGGGPFGSGQTEEKCHQRRQAEEKSRSNAAVVKQGRPPGRWGGSKQHTFSRGNEDQKVDGGGRKGNRKGEDSLCERSPRFVSPKLNFGKGRLTANGQRAVSECG